MNMRWSNAAPRGARGGFTLIEILVTIFVIGLLIGLLMPAVQAAREAGRRMSCTSNLRQMGIALHQYHATHETFPPGGWEPRSKKWPRGRQIAWSALILRQLEQGGLFENIDFGKAFDDAENAEAAAHVLHVYLCPSTPRQSNLVDGRGACDYGGIYGERITSPNNPPKGTMLYDKAIRIVDIQDGTTRTLIVAEDSGFKDGQWINARNVFDQAYPINRAPESENDIRSNHGDGANALLADGSTRFLEESMDLKVLAALCTRAGRETDLME